MDVSDAFQMFWTEVCSRGIRQNVFFLTGLSGTHDPSSNTVALPCHLSQEKLAENHGIDLAEIQRVQTTMVDQLEVLQQQLGTTIDKCEMKLMLTKMFLEYSAATYA